MDMTAYRETLMRERERVAALDAPPVRTEVDPTATDKQQRSQRNRRKREQAHHDTFAHLKAAQLARLDAAIACIEMLDLLTMPDGDLGAAQDIDASMSCVQEWRRFNLGWFDDVTVWRKVPSFDNPNELTDVPFGPYRTFRYVVNGQTHNYYLGHINKLAAMPWEDLHTAFNATFRDKE